MMNRTLIHVFVLALCFMFIRFTTPVYASDGDEEILTVNAAWLDGEMLRINVTDADGVSSALALRLTDYVSEAENSEYISIQAVDLVGNKSGVIQIKNPYYDPTKESETKTDTTIETEVSQEVSPDTSLESQSAVPEDGNAFTPNGTGTVMDNATDGDGKEFFTIDTEDGSVFYLIVDRQRNTDNVYLLNAVTEEDLMALAEKNGKTISNGNNGSTSAIPSTEQQGTTDGDASPPTTTPTPEPDSKAPVNGGFDSNTLIFVVIAVLAVGGAGYYFKIVRGKKDAPDTDDEDDYEFEDEPEEPDESGAPDDYDVYETESEGDGV